MTERLKSPVPLATRIQQFLHKCAVPGQLVHHARGENWSDVVLQSGVAPELCARAVPLIDRRGPAVAVIPHLAELDLGVVNKGLGRSFQELGHGPAAKLFKDCEPGMIPALAMAYGLPVLLDASLLDLDHVYVCSGSHSALLKLNGASLATAMRGAVKVHMGRWPEQGSSSVASHAVQERSLATMSLDQVARKLERVYKLPPMPDTAMRILHMVNDPEASVAELAILIERDPSLSAQVMRYARSALFAYRGELNSIKDAINIVLGFDRVSQLAMGIAASQAFKISGSGPLGLQAFWRHALNCGVLSQALAVLAKPEFELSEQEAYLCGLLHNFGVLLIGHLFPPEFKMLNKLRESEPEAAMSDIEQQVFGIGSAQDFIAMGHGSMGAILLKLWGLPEAVIKAAAMHQQPAYEGEHALMVHIVQLSNCLLAEYGIGDEPASEAMLDLCGQLGIAPEQARELAAVTVEQCQSLDALVSDIAA
ncbi:MAG: HDOD domain-containing protein [Oleiphilaceae bacterium]|nr:HDOD domain-containing protein [Oleiphilaceae bacterium]